MAGKENISYLSKEHNASTFQNMFPPSLFKAILAKTILSLETMQKM
jgi:hypothetical protein